VSNDEVIRFDNHSGTYDTKYFEKFEEIEAFYPSKTKNKFKRKDVEYLGYDFNKDNFENDLKTEYENAMNTINY